MPTEVMTGIGQLGLAAVFIFAWMRSEQKRDTERKEYEERHEKLIAQLLETQTAHRREILTILKSFLIYPDEKPIKNRDFILEPAAPA